MGARQHGASSTDLPPAYARGRFILHQTVKARAEWVGVIALARSHANKYAPLADYLRQHVDGEVTLSLREIEAILGTPLPPSASTRQFWANGLTGTFRRGVWRQAGWRKVRPRMRTVPETVILERLPAVAIAESADPNR